MGTLFRMFAPLGRLYDPLLQLAERVHAALARRRRIVWADDKGCVFVDDPGQELAAAPRTLIGSYDARTPLSVIENDLRLALRERASDWILDWNVVGGRPGDPRTMSPNAQRRPRRRAVGSLAGEGKPQRPAPASVA